MKGSREKRVEDTWHWGESTWAVTRAHGERLEMRLSVRPWMVNVHLPSAVYPSQDHRSESTPSQTSSPAASLM